VPLRAAAVAAGSRAAAADPVKVYLLVARALFLSGVHAVFSFPDIVVGDLLEQLAPRAGGLRVPFTDSLPRLDLVPILVWWRFDGALNRVLC
jgi:hypothetical protein